MAVIVPARGTYPGVQPVGRTEPEQDVLQEDVEGVVQAQTYGWAYQGRGHVGQLTPDQAYTDQAAYTTPIEQLVVPRHACTGLVVAVQVNSDAGCDVKVTAAPTVGAPVVATSLGIAAGVQEVAITCAAVNGEDQVVLVSIGIQRAGGGTWASIESFSIVDADL